MMAVALLITVLIPALLAAGFWFLARPEARYVGPSAACLVMGGLMFVPMGFLDGFLAGRSGAVFTIITVVVAPLLEELVKCLPVVPFLRSRPPASRGLILGLASGTGYGITENALFILSEPNWQVALARALSTSVMHATSTALIIFVICQVFKHEHHHRGTALGVAAAGVVLRRVALRVAVRTIAPSVGRQAGVIAVVALLAGATFLIAFGFVWFTLAALLEELKAERSEAAPLAAAASL